MSTATIDHRTATVLTPAVQLAVVAALAALYVVAPTEQGRRVVATVSGWADGVLGLVGDRPLAALLVGTVVAVGFVVVVVVGVLRERLWAVVYTVEEGVALGLLVGVYGWLLANSAVVFLVVVAAQGAATTVRHRRV